MVIESNIFREAQQLLKEKLGCEMTQDEQELVAAAMIPLMVHGAYSDIPIDDALEDLARILEGQ